MEEIKDEDGNVIMEVASKKEAAWIKAKESTEKRLEMHEEGIMMDTAFLELCNAKIEQLKNGD